MIVVIVLAAFLCLILVVKSLSSDGGAQNSRQSSAPRRQSTVRRSTTVAAAPTQAEYNRAREADRIANQQVRRSFEARSNASLMYMRDIETSFVSQQEALARESERLESQLQRLMSQRLQESNFSQYIQLHHASRDAADKRYEALVMSRRSLDQIGQVIVAIGKGTIHASKREKQYAYLLKDAIKACRDANKENVDLLNHQTHMFKIKIRDECGPGGRNWYQQLESKNARGWG